MTHISPLLRRRYLIVLQKKRQKDVQQMFFFKSERPIKVPTIQKNAVITDFKKTEKIVRCSVIKFCKFLSYTLSSTISTFHSQLKTIIL